jgi:porphobilinogen synthase
LPGQYRWSVDRLPEAADTLRDQGVRSMLIFGLPDAADKDPTGRAAAADNSLVVQALNRLTTHDPDLILFTDVCLCAYTDHGHCGPLTTDGQVDNDAANTVLSTVAVTHAAAGAHGVAPSAMMDGQVAALRAALDTAGHNGTLIMSYSTKFASAMYGPFRDAGESAPGRGDRQGYQAPCGDRRQALRESQLDEAEGADILMVKPALFYLDIVAALRAQTDLPLAVYNVSGEYAMLLAAAERGWGDLGAMVRESLVAFTRAGADIIISYWASRLNEIDTS